MKIPNNLDEAIQILKEMKVNPEEINSRAIRNEWGLWSGSILAQWFYKKQIYHADDMSGIIVESYERHLKGKDIELDKQIEGYHDFWRMSMGINFMEKLRSQVADNLAKMRDEDIDKVIK